MRNLIYSNLNLKKLLKYIRLYTLETKRNLKLFPAVKNKWIINCFLDKGNFNFEGNFKTWRYRIESQQISLFVLEISTQL